MFLTRITAAQNLGRFKITIAGQTLTAHPADPRDRSNHPRQPVPINLCKSGPMFHHQRDAIEAHLTIVFTALAVARHLQEMAGHSIRRIVQTLRPLREVEITVAGQTLTAHQQIPSTAQTILDSLTH